jgi:hypothetical protein
MSSPSLVGKPGSDDLAHESHGSKAAILSRASPRPVNDRRQPSQMIQDASGRLRISTLDALEPRAKEDARVWHAGCLHA